MLDAVGVQYAALARYQADDGSFAMFPGDESSVWLTSHVIKTLMIANFQVCIHNILRGGQSVRTDGRSINPSLTDSRFAGGLTTDGNVETLTEYAPTEAIFGRHPNRH